MNIDELKVLRVRLKTGEYEGEHIMQAWLAIDQLVAVIAALESAEAREAELRKVAEFYKAQWELLERETVGQAITVAELRAEVERLRGMVQDAVRYRKLRHNPAMLLHLKRAEFDAAIDALPEAPHD